MASEPVPAALDQPEPEALRRAHSRDEAYIKAVGRLNYLYAVLFILEGSYYLRFTYLYLSGAINAAWTVRPGWLAFQAACFLTAAFALFAGYGFRRLRRWALGAEVLFMYGALFVWVLSIVAARRPTSLPEFAGGLTLMTTLFAPLLNLWDVHRSFVFTPEYLRVISATPGMRIRERIPWAFKLPAIVSFVAFIMICVYVGIRAGG
jgi:hypothetical protein